MSEAVQVAEISDEEALQHPFIKELVKVIRANDSYGTWERKPDSQLLSAFILDKEARKKIPIIGDPDPDTLWRLDMYYNAAALLIEKTTGMMASPMRKMSHEGFGRMVLTVGYLVAVSKHLRDVHRFGFPSFAKLAEEGQKVVDGAAALIARFPEAAAGE